MYFTVVSSWWHLRRCLSPGTSTPIVPTGHPGRPARGRPRNPTDTRKRRRYPRLPPGPPAPGQTARHGITVVGMQSQGAETSRPDEPSITTRGLTRRFAAITAVDGLDLDVRYGEVYGLLGPNGAGKTTTLRMLLGLARPTAGTAVVAGGPPGSPASLARVGSMIETPAFWPYLSGRDNLRSLAAYVGASDARVEEALVAVDLEPRGHHRFSTYSMGMKQRLGVAAALLRDPDVLVLDEPSSGLDPAGMIEMRELIAGLRKERRTVLLSSHLLAEVEHICDRVGVLQHGRLIAQGTIAELRGQGKLVLRAAPADRAQAV